MDRHITMGALLTLTTGCVVGGGEQALRFDDLQGLRIELGSGDITVVSERGRAARTDVFLDLGGIGEKNARGEITEGADGWVTVDARGSILGGGDIEAWVPSGLPVELLLERGDVTVDLDGRSDVAACVAAGDLDVFTPSGGYLLQLEAGAGAVSTEEVWHDPAAATTLDLCVGAGDLAVVGVR